MFLPHFFGMTIAPFASRFFGLAKKRWETKEEKNCLQLYAREKSYMLQHAAYKRTWGALFSKVKEGGNWAKPLEVNGIQIRRERGRR